MKRPAVIAGALMLFAALMQWISLSLFRDMLVSFGLYTLLACVAVPVAYLLIVEKTPASKLASTLKLWPASKRQIGGSIALGLAMALAMVLGFVFLDRIFLRENRALDVVAVWGLKRAPTFWIYFAGLTLNGITEEVFWRGLTHHLLRDEKRRWWAVAFPALVFGSQHIFVISALVPNAFTIALFMAAIIGSGFLWGILREKTGSLFVCAACHAIVSLGYLGILAFYVFR